MIGSAYCLGMPPSERAGLQLGYLAFFMVLETAIQLGVVGRVPLSSQWSADCSDMPPSERVDRQLGHLLWSVVLAAHQILFPQL